MSEITLEFKPEDKEPVDTEPIKAVADAVTANGSKRDKTT